MATNESKAKERTKRKGVVIGAMPKKVIVVSARRQWKLLLNMAFQKAGAKKARSLSLVAVKCNQLSWRGTGDAWIRVKWFRPTGMSRTAKN